MYSRTELVETIKDVLTTSFRTIVIQFRRGTAQEWTMSDRILLEGEPGFEIDTGKFKLGRGNVPWNALPYAGGSGGSIAYVDLPPGSPIYMDYDPSTSSWPARRSSRPDLKGIWTGDTNVRPPGALQGDYHFKKAV